MQAVNASRMATAAARPQPPTTAARAAAAGAAAAAAAETAAQAQAATPADTPLAVVQLDALVVMKILKHCRDAVPATAMGQLLGLDVGERLEVTNCFAVPAQKEDDAQNLVEDYQAEMMRSFRDVNIDNNAVGWYQSTYLGSFVGSGMLESQFNYQSNIAKSVVIIYGTCCRLWQRGRLGMDAYTACRLVRVSSLHRPVPRFARHAGPARLPPERQGHAALQEQDVLHGHVRGGRTECVLEGVRMALTCWHGHPRQPSAAQAQPGRHQPAQPL